MTHPFKIETLQLSYFRTEDGEDHRLNIIGVKQLSCHLASFMDKRTHQ